MSKRIKSLRSQVDNSFAYGGHQMVKARERKREIPLWANNKSKVKALLLLAFPKLMVDIRQRTAASRWARVIQLYFGARYTYAQVAEEMNLTKGQVLGDILHIKRVAAGQRANGSGPRGGKRGRPKSK